MPTDYRIDKDARRVFVRSWGAFDAQESADCILQMTRDPDYEPGFNILVDGLSLKETGTRLEELEEFADTFEEVKNAVKGKMAVVAMGPLLPIGQLAAALIVSQGLEVQTFGDTASAEAWLDE